MKVEFYFDPSCPFCWITSRWIIQVKDARQLSITWRPFSLAIKNGELGDDAQPPHHMSAHRVLRVIQAAANTGADMGDLYTAFGSQRHIMGEDFGDDLISQVLAEQHLPADLLRAAGETSLDVDLQKSLDSALEVVGDDVGVPTIIFDDDGKRTGYFGPVLQDLPGVAESLKLWDSLAVMAGMDNFYELKRTRPAAGPNTASTAICLP